jgi:glycosyltransferase involved in cell wall biosynthesis
VTQDQWPAVSVVVATRDRKELLRAAIAAIARQDYPGVVEIIVVHDQSVPDAALASDDERRPVRVVSNTHTPGLAGARNTGILASEQPIIAFCDDDDTWLPPKLRLQVAKLDADNADVGVAGCTICYAGHEIDRVPRAGGLTVDALSRGRVTEAHPSAVIARRAAVLGPIGLVDEKIPGSYGEDYDWLLRAVEHGPISILEQPMVRVLWSQTHSYYMGKWAVTIEAIDYLLAKHPALARNRHGLAWNSGRKAFGYAALGDRREAVRWALRTIVLDWRERRAYLALAVAAGLVSAERIQAWAHTRGKGI